MDLSAVVMELLQYGIGDSATHAAANHADLLLALGLGGLAQGAHEVLEAVALVQMGQLLSSGADRLDNDGDGSFFRVIVIDRDGDTLAVLIHPQNDELARLRFLGYQGSLNLIQGNGGTQGLFSHNTIHTFPSFTNGRILIRTDILPLTLFTF